jgi:general secretion pathway protein D
VALAEKLIDDLDKAKPEVLVDVVVMVVNRERIHNIGITPPTSATVALQSNVTTNSTTSSTSSSTSTTNTATANTTGSINLNNFANLTAQNFAVTISPATVNFLASDSKTKLIQNPQIRALDGQKASLKIGQRVPVATGSFGAGVGGVGITNTLVNTQFQYLDVGVNIDITPKVHAGREVTLKLMLDISAVDSTVSIGGINQPVIGQRKIEHEIRLRDGEASLLGGILEDQDIKSMSGWPLFSSIPILKYLVSSTNTDHTQNELVFVLIPHIVRGQELSGLNVKPIDVGTGNTIELRHLDVAPEKPATPAAAPTVPKGALTPGNRPVQPATTGAGSVVPASVPVPAGPGTLLSFSPGDVHASKGQTFMMDVVVSGAQNLFSAPVQIQYDPTKLQVVNVSNGGFLGQGEQAVALAQRDDPSQGLMQVTANRPPNSGGVSGGGTVFTLTFLAKDSGQATVSISRAGLRDASNQPIVASGTQAVVDIKGGPGPQ